MSKTKYSAGKVLTDSDRIAAVWQENPGFSLGELTLEVLQTERGKLQVADTAVDDHRVVLTRLINERDDQAYDLNQLVTRARSGFRAVYGPDSSQYEQAGGTRSSERKSRSKKSEEQAPAE